MEREGLKQSHVTFHREAYKDSLRQQYMNKVKQKREAKLKQQRCDLEEYTFAQFLKEMLQDSSIEQVQQDMLRDYLEEIQSSSPKQQQDCEMEEREDVLHELEEQEQFEEKMLDSYLE